MKRELRRFGPNAGIGDAVGAWPDAVGPEIARNAWPARFQRDGTLVVHTRDAVWAFELTQRAREIGKRLGGMPDLKFVPGPLPEPGSEPPEATPRGSPLPTAEQQARAAAWTVPIDDPELREIVSRAAAASLARRSE